MLNARIKILANHDGQATDRIKAKVRSTTSLHHDDVIHVDILIFKADMRIVERKRC